MPTRAAIPLPAGFELPLTLFSHGWIDLEPFHWDRHLGVWSFVLNAGRRTFTVEARMSGPKLVAEWAGGRSTATMERRQVVTAVTRMLGLREELGGLWDVCRRVPRLAWVVRRRAGRLLRGAGPFEDLLKILMTTNCTWAATRGMVGRCVRGLGRSAADGRHAFPGADACLEAGETWFREVCRTGYRSRAIVALANAFVNGGLEAEIASLSDDLPALRRRLHALDGFGPYAVGQALRLLGIHESLAVDSWCRARHAELSGRRRPRTDRAIEREYAAFGNWRGLVFWLDMTAAWHGERAGPGDGILTAKR